jgi:hypothetical protein
VFGYPPKRKCSPRLWNPRRNVWGVIAEEKNDHNSPKNVQPTQRTARSTNHQRTTEKRTRKVRSLITCA